MIEFVTIGVYGWDAERFFAELQRSNVDTLVDIRRRRAVRGAEYAFANSQRLQARLAQMGIRYTHRIDLAPSDGLRKEQAVTDHETHVARRQRTELSDQFRAGFVREVLDGFDSREFMADLGSEAQIVGLLCVERRPEACHRGLLAEHLQQDLGIKVSHLAP
jgi:uncharacterized protein (DUF488 family)